MSTGPTDPELDPFTDPDFDPSYDHAPIEAACRDLWERTGIHRYDPDDERPTFSVDTPPPYVSAAHLHVGHAMSYTQAEICVRWHRMRGFRIHYPMGFDDNGLPTERYVEQAHGVDKGSIARSDFRALCLEETRRGAEAYEELWRSLGLSVDWSLSYSTIDATCRRTAQQSFLDAFSAGRIYRADDPVLWDPELQTSLAHADLETKTRRQKLHTLRFTASDGNELPIATTRPELLAACVALYHHPDDRRWEGVVEATVPLFGHTVPLRTDAEVDRDFGTGLMMVCTFGDAEDVHRYKRDGLPLRIVIGADGTLTDRAGPYAGLAPTTARKRIVADLDAAGVYDGFTMTEQALPVGERSGAAVEWRTAPQWFLKVLDRRERLLQMSAQLRWFPAHMKARLDHWIEGLRWDWNLSRQRFYGVPFPVWLCRECEHPVLARAEDLPVDPLEDPPPCEACPECGGALRGDPDVMDTWMTSSMTPWIAGPAPRTVRVQAFEIIRTWLFYTLVKADLHTGALPWRDVMISGWGLNEQGKKISKRDLQKSSDPSGFNRYDPAHLIDRYGADALRHWAARSALGQDLRYHEKHVRAGRRTVVKLWNAARLGWLSLEGFDPEATRPEVDGRPPEDRDLLHRLDVVIETVDAGMGEYDYASGLRALDRFFFEAFCDDWLESIKDRVQRPERFPEGSAAAARATLFEALRTLIGLYAPYLPFVTEALWQRLYRAHEGGPSLHTTRFPTPRCVPPVDGLAVLHEVRRLARGARTEARIPQSREVALTVIGPRRSIDRLAELEASVRAACRVRELTLSRMERDGAIRVIVEP